MIDLVFKFIIASGCLAMIYRLYLAFSQGHETAVENKNAKEVLADLDNIKKDKEDVKKSTDDFNDLVNDFERNNKK